MNRRQLLQRAGAAGLAVAVGGIELPEIADAATDGLALTPEQEEGPFYVALDKIRKNITLGRPGIPLQLRIKVVNTAGAPVKGAACDIWQCDATGVYSDESSESTVGQTWLRGVQLTDAKGVAEFITIYPGHYQGRTTHIHIKVHTGGHVSHTGQILFSDAITTQVYAFAPYNTETVARTYNSQDQVYTQEQGSKSMVKLSRLGTTVKEGYAGRITLVVDPKATPAAAGR
jgi:protocatechuate 3,4-dioxygenase beta subunit